MQQSEEVGSRRTASRFKWLAIPVALGLLLAACSGSSSVSEVDPLTGCGPRNVASAREVATALPGISLGVDGLARGALSPPAYSSRSNSLRLPFMRLADDLQRNPSELDDQYTPPWFPWSGDYTSADYWDQRSGLVDTTDEIARITDDLAEWASTLLSTMTMDDQRWVDTARSLASQEELEEQYDSYRRGLTALAERRKTFSYAVHTEVAPRPPTGVRRSSNEDLLYLSFAETELDRFGNTLAVSNVEGSTDFRIIAAEPMGNSDPTRFVRGGSLDLTSDGSDTQFVSLALAFGEGLGGSTLDKRRFTFGASIQFEPFPTVDPLAGLSFDAQIAARDDSLAREVYRYYLDQNNILIGGRTSGWISVELNLRCQIEISLNRDAMDMRVDRHSVILVSERVLDIAHASQILLSVDSEAKEVMLTTGDDGLEAMVTEVFDLPEDFRFSFDALSDASVCEEIDSCTTDPDEVENFLSIASEMPQDMQPRGLRGAVDWMYLANGVLAPQDASAHLIALDLQGSARAERGDAPTFTVSPNGHVVSLVLEPDEYERFLDADPTDRVRVIVQEAILEFGDDFDMVTIVPREPMSELAMGTDAARNYGVQRTPGAYNLDFVFPDTVVWGDPDRLLSVMIGRSSEFMTTRTFLHEIAHTWGNDVVFPTGTPQYLTDGHFGVSSVNGYLGGFDPATLRSEGPGAYSAARFAPYAGLPESFADIELYFMGLLPAEDVEDITMFVNVSDLEDRGDRTYFTAEGSEIISIEDIERLAGERRLETDTAFTMLYIVVSGGPLGEAQLADYDAQAVFAAELFRSATRGLATLSLEPVGR